MIGYVTIDKEGWVQEIYTGGSISDEQIPVADQDTIHKLKSYQFIMLWDGKQFCQVKNPKDIWKRIRLCNIHGAAAEHEYQHCLDNLNPAFPDVPAGMVIDEPPMVKKMFDTSFEMEFKPGLRICQSTDDDIDLWEKAMIDSGLYTKDEAWKYAARWLSESSVWNVKVVWKDRALQLENYHLGSNIASNGFQTHIDRTRPQWFYKQMAKPVLKAMYAEGIETIMAQVRKDRPDWATYLAEVYGSEILKITDKAIIMRTKIKDSLALIGEWPTRRTLGQDWRWEKDGILVREATEDDFPTIYQTIDDSWGDKPRKQLAISNFEDRWTLDSAAILLTVYEGKILEAKMFRERKDQILNYYADILRNIIDTRTDLAFIGMLEWQKAVGYKETSFIIETKLFERVKDSWLKKGWVIYRQNDNITECRMNIEEALATK